MSRKSKKRKNKLSTSQQIKIADRRRAICRLMVEDKQKSSCREMAQRLHDLGIESSKATVQRDYNDPDFKRELKECLYEVFSTEVIYHAADNIAASILLGDEENSKWLMEHSGFFPPPELQITGRMKAPGATTEDELAALLTPELIESMYKALTSEPDEIEGDPPSDESQVPEIASGPQDHK